MEDPPKSYNTKLVSDIYSSELQEHLNDMRQLNSHLTEVTKIFKQDSAYLSEEEKKDKVQEMKEYIEQALASLAYSTTHATQKVG